MIIVPCVSEWTLLSGLSELLSFPGGRKEEAGKMCENCASGCGQKVEEGCACLDLLSKTTGAEGEGSL